MRRMELQVDGNQTKGKILPLKNIFRSSDRRKRDEEKRDYPSDFLHASLFFFLRRRYADRIVLPCGQADRADQLSLLTSIGLN